MSLLSTKPKHKSLEPRKLLVTSHKQGRTVVTNHEKKKKNYLL